VKHQVILFSLILLSGCQIGKHSPTATVLPSGKIVTSGDAATPAHVTETVTQASMPVPVQSTVVTSPGDGTIKVQVSQPTTLTVSTKSTHVDGPVAFTPPAPPTPAQEAQGFGVRIFWIASLLCLLGAGLCAYTDHWLACGCCALAAVALPVLANFFSSQIALYVGGALVVAGIVFVIAWYVIDHQRKAQNLTPVKP
jgi:hypothetical protein